MENVSGSFVTGTESRDVPKTTKKTGDQVGKGRDNLYPRFRRRVLCQLKRLLLSLRSQTRWIRVKELCLKGLWQGRRRLLGASVQQATNLSNR